jgi:iron complex transport system ATP-binding protein
MTTPTLSLTDVCVKRGKRDIVNNVSLEVASGEVVALVGPNGAGKSSILATLSGDLTPEKGEAMLMNRPTSSYRPMQQARLRAMLLQANQVSFPFTVQQVVDMGRSPWAGQPEEERDDEAVAEAISSVEIGHLLSRRFNELSGGERARVSLARVLAQETPIVLLDEPTAALDLHHQERVMGLIRRLGHEGKSVVVVVHDLNLAAAYADRVALIVEGRVDAMGPSADVITAERISEVYRVEVDVLIDNDGRQIVVPKRRGGVFPGGI